jgi:peptidoglycan/xylan/chitin deacetylase (PgdA/CDA1 family)
MSAAQQFACVTYHIVGELEHRYDNRYTVSQAQLRDQLAFLRGEAFVVDSFEQLEMRLRSSEELPCRYVVLTIDDGHESAMLAADILGEYGFKATFFLTRDRCLRKPRFIRAPEIRELRRRGFSLGTHGTTHRRLTVMPRESCINELKGSKQWLEDIIGEGVRYMAAPAGFINGGVLKLAYEQAYVLVGTSHEWMNTPGTLRLPGNVSRVSIRRHFSSQDFRRIVHGSLGFYVARRLRALALSLPKQLHMFPA